MMLLDDSYDAAALRRYKGFIFDCDGVLIDSLQANVVYYSKLPARISACRP